MPSYMGNTPSSGVTITEFKDQIFGSVIFLLAPQADVNLKFKAAKDITDTDSNTLPEALGEKDLYEATLKYYGSADSDRDVFVEKFVNENILVSQEKLTAFYKLLVDRLRPARAHQSQAQQTQQQSPSTGI